MYHVDKTWHDDLRKRIAHQEENWKKMIAIRVKFSENDDNEKELRNLDSALKKTTSFMKKIKNFNAAAIPSMIEEMSKLNLSKFIEEMAAGIVETKLKISDIPKVADLCVAISSRYSKFSEIIASEFKKVLPVKKTDKITNLAKLRTDIVFLAELILCGVFNQKEGLQVLGCVLGFIVQTDKSEFLNVGLVTTICRHVGWQIAKIIPLPSPEDVNIVEISEKDLPVSNALVDDQKNTIRDLLNSYYNALYKKTKKKCSMRNKALRVVKKQERSRGDAGENEKNGLKTTQNEFDNYRKMAEELSSALGIKMEELNEEGSDDEEDVAAKEEMGRALAEGEINMWVDDESKAFYEDLIDIRQMVPNSLYSESEKKTIEKMSTVKDIADIDVENINESGEMDTFQHRKSLSVELNEKVENLKDNEDMLNVGDKKTDKWKAFMVDLDHLVSRYSADQAAVLFVSDLNNPKCRKKLVKIMANPPSGRMDILPFYARLIATLENVMPDTITEIVNQLLETFRHFFQKESGVRLEVKMVNVMLIAELIKFGVVSRAEGLSCLRQLVYDMRGDAVDMIATMLESAGLYLYRNTDSHAKMKRLLEVVKSKRDRMKDSRQVMLIDNAYFTCLPPEESQKEREKLKLMESDTPMKRFIRHIILDIKQDNVDLFLKCLRRLDWSDRDISDYALRLMSSPWLMSPENLEHMASAIAGLKKLQQLGWIGMVVIDSTIETIRLALEHPGLLNQWGISASAYLAELYNFELCDEDLIMKILYQLVIFPEERPDSWRDLFRIRMVFRILSISGEFFKRGEANKKMKYFLIYFHRYYYTKKDQWEEAIKTLTTDEVDLSVSMKFPYEVDVEFHEVMKQFRRFSSASPWPKNTEESISFIEVIEAKMKRKFEETIKNVEDVNFSSGRRSDDDLEAIAEEDEEENREDPNKINMDNEEQLLNEKREREKAMEDEEFQRKLDRLMGDSYTVHSQSSRDVDLSIPTATKDRFHRSIRFAPDTKEEQLSPNYVDSFFAQPIKKENQECTENKRIGLLTRVKGKQQLKPIFIEDESLRERWKMEREREEKEKADIKRLTLGQHRRIEMEEEKARKANIYNRMKFKKK